MGDERLVVHNHPLVIVPARHKEGGVSWRAGNPCPALSGTSLLPQHPIQPGLRDNTLALQLGWEPTKPSCCACCLCSSTAHGSLEFPKGLFRLGAHRHTTSGCLVSQAPPHRPSETYPLPRAPRIPPPTWLPGPAPGSFPSTAYLSPLI